MMTHDEFEVAANALQAELDKQPIAVAAAIFYMSGRNLAMIYAAMVHVLLDSGDFDW